MPKGFTDAEKAHLRAQLLAQGRAFLATTGIRKTSVEDLVAAVHISKGAFYLFFPSKEELFLTLFEQMEAAYHAALLDVAAQATGAPQERLRTFFDQAFALWRSSPLFRHFGEDEYGYLLRKLPPERVAAALHTDERFVAALLARWHAQGIAITLSPAEFTGLLRALFFVSFHAEDIGPAYPATITLLIELLVGHLAQAAAAPEGGQDAGGL
jgi:AcrR family transcriptional regulator